MSPGPHNDLILDPAHLADVEPYKLLQAAAAGYLGVDHRFLHAIVDRSTSIPDLVRFAAEDHENDPVNLDRELIDIFQYLRTPEAVPFLVGLLRRHPNDIDDDLAEALLPVGSAAVDPLIELLEELERDGKDPGEVPFYLSQLRVRDPRILDALTRRLAAGDPEAPLYLDMYGDPAAIPALEAALAKLPLDEIPDAHGIRSFIEDLSRESEKVEEPEEPFLIWEYYPKEDSPPLDVLNDHARLAMLASGSAELKTDVARFYRGGEFSGEVRARLLEIAKLDPDPNVRGECWESLGDFSDEPEMRRAMLGVLTEAGSSVEEKGGAAIALSLQTDNAVVFQAIENLYSEPRGRAKALKAMGRSFDRRFAEYPPRHLDDPDIEVKRQAIWAVGYLNLSSEAPRLEPFFDDDELRNDALFAYALCVPGDTSRSRIRSLLNKIDDAAGGFRPDEVELVEMALDQRLMLHGKKPAFSADDDESSDEPEMQPAVPAKVGRNDPCPCGSGKKYKKCCGA